MDYFPIPYQLIGYQTKIRTDQFVVDYDAHDFQPFGPITKIKNASTQPNLDTNQTQEDKDQIIVSTAQARMHG